MPVRILGSVILFLSLGLIRPVFAQSMLQGYTRTVSGAVLKYHSPHPDVKTSLLVRARHDVGEIIWETEAVPSDHDEETVRFVWMFGIDVNHQERKYFLFVDGIHAFTFSNPPDTSHRDWTVTGLLGGSLRFRSSLIDKYGDIMGYALMEIPS